jgi:hypothetical protein
MQTSSISDKPQKLFIVVILSSFSSITLFMFTMIANALIVEPIKDKIVVDEFAGLVFAINLVAYQNYLLVYCLTIYVVYLRLKDISDFMKKIENTQEISKEEVYKIIKVVAILVDKVCDVLETIKFCFSINTVTYMLHTSFFFILCVYGNFSYFFRLNSTELDFSHNLIILSWSFYYLPFLLSIFLVGNWIKSEGKIIEVQIEKLSQQSSNANEKSR